MTTIAVHPRITAAYTSLSELVGTARAANLVLELERAEDTMARRGVLARIVQVLPPIEWGPWLAEHGYGDSFCHNCGAELGGRSPVALFNGPTLCKPCGIALDYQTSAVAPHGPSYVPAPRRATRSAARTHIPPSGPGGGRVPSS